MILDKNFFKYSCTKCGACSEIFPKNFSLNTYDDNFVLKKSLTNKEKSKFYKFCPGTGVNFVKNLKSKKYLNYLVGNHINFFIGYSNKKKIRLNSASGGIISEISIFLLKYNYVDYIIMPIKDKKSQTFKYSFSNNKNNILNNSQSIYYKIPYQDIIEKVKELKKKVAFIGLPDQIYSIRQIAKFDKNLNKFLKYSYGPMVGINMDKNSIDGIRREFNIKKKSKLQYIKWRDGLWPGYLNIKFSNHKRIKINKFYYNFLLPFYCSYETLFSSDFYNEFADFSVGDAWSPKYENSISGGVSIISVKNKKFFKIFNKLKLNKKIYLEEINNLEALKMHSHMVDFKKRGSIYRRKIFSFFGKKVPNNKSLSPKLSFKRFLIEIAIVIVIVILKSNFGKLILNFSSPKLLGKVFDKTRLFWKKITIKTKRDRLLNGIK